MNLKHLLALVSIVCLLTSNILGQNREIKYNFKLSGLASTEKNLPFWAKTNVNGLLPQTNGGTFALNFHSPFVESNKFQIAYGFSTAGYVSDGKNKLILDQIYLSGKWRKLQLDAGMIHREGEFEDLSISGGNVIYSNNTRTMPGYNFRVHEVAVPFTNEKFLIRLNFADYWMMDKRYVKDVRLHNQSLYGKVILHPRLEFEIGIEDWAQWAGTNPVYGKQPSSLKDYIRIITGRGGNENATSSDQINALGNHLGREILRFNYLGDKHYIAFQHDILYEDGSGMGFQNFPDGINTLYISFKDKKKGLMALVYEFTYTKCQSGRFHDRVVYPDGPDGPPKTLVRGGADNYFNNGEYRSGWTYYGQTIGLPLITPKAPNEDGITLGVNNNRLVSHHVGLKGIVASKFSSRLLLTYSRNNGMYKQSDKKFDKKPEQFSFLLETQIPEMRKFPFAIKCGVYGDFGELYTNSVGFKVELNFNGRFNLK